MRGLRMAPQTPAPPAAIAAPDRGSLDDFMSRPSPRDFQLAFESA